MRVYEIANDLGISTEKTLKLLSRYGLDVKSHMSKVEDMDFIEFKYRYDEIKEAFSVRDLKEEFEKNDLNFMSISDAAGKISEAAIKVLSSMSKFQDTSRIREALHDDNLVLVIGSGISTYHSIPSWVEFLQKMMLSSVSLATHEPVSKASTLSKIFSKLFNPNPLVAGRFIEDFFCGDVSDDMDFENAVRAALYQNLEIHFDSKIHLEIVQMCIAPGKSPNLDCIITYNFDDLIEEYLDNASVDINYVSIFSDGVNPGKNNLPIYHVHGFLPRNGELSKENQIIFSERLYHQQYYDIYSWSNLVQINKFREKNCLFLGTSVNDPNLRRLLDISKKLRGDEGIHHFCVKKRISIDEVEEDLRILLSRSKDILNEKEMNNLEFTDTVRHLAKIQESFEESDLASFGVKVLWVDDYDEISNILKNIRGR